MPIEHFTSCTSTTAAWTTLIRQHIFSESHAAETDMPEPDFILVVMQRICDDVPSFTEGSSFLLIGITRKLFGVVAFSGRTRAASSQSWVHLAEHCISSCGHRCRGSLDGGTESGAVPLRVLCYWHLAHDLRVWEKADGTDVHSPETGGRPAFQPCPHEGEFR